jgi:hypothetical protein
MTGVLRVMQSRVAAVVSVCSLIGVATPRPDRREGRAASWVLVPADREQNRQATETLP